MVDNLQRKANGDASTDFPLNLVGCTREASIVSATEGAIVVSVDIGSRNFRGVLLEEAKEYVYIRNKFIYIYYIYIFIYYII